MPTLLDNTLKSKNMVLAFGGVVAAATAWMLAGDLFPADPEPKGDPETWTREEMRRWLEASCTLSRRPKLVSKICPSSSRGARPRRQAASSVGTGNIADGAKAVILGGGYDDNDYEVMRKAVDAATLERRPVWLRNDLSVAMPPPGPKYGKAVVVRVKNLLSKLDKENRLNGADSDIYWF
ncbi:uncharacterized protein BBA_07793 [Beauveria bassiana ARSEF 2860]|uniref:Uncharacterized protein n=1 Tax=Beauveria bassiana (strain ARSEF 2860) TaxID=655819 RepID=J5JAI8_BEAB2|nr:uncharacterized protein BBA_07793 [Beauveria bassiana ARSEF 2860]EJP63193.1 hypothetical protein BBA_07793 [Beauveria bassiana ARSEF 2860]